MNELAVQSPRTGNGTNAWQFSLKSLILMTAFVAVCAGLFRLFAPLGVLFLIFATPALLRTKKHAAACYDTNQSLGMMAMITTFIRSLGLLVLIIITMLATLASTCLVACLVVINLIAKCATWCARVLTQQCNRNGWLYRRAAAGLGFCYASNTTLIRRFRLQ